MSPLRWSPAVACIALLALAAHARADLQVGEPPYERVLGDDWSGYRDTEDLRARVPFFSFDRSRRTRDFIRLVSDPTFGQVVRVTQPATTDAGYSPELRRRFATPLDRVWFRWRMRYSPGWTTVGPNPPKANNAYKIAFITWANGVGERAQVVWANTDKYLFGMSQKGVATTEIRLATTGWYNTRQTTEWQGQDWWEFVMCFERLDATHARARFWKRQVTRGGRVVSTPYDFGGWEFTAVSGQFAPAGGIALGVNKNKSTPREQYIDWGPWEVVDGSRYPNPFNLPNVR